MNFVSWSLSKSSRATVVLIQKGFPMGMWYSKLRLLSFNQNILTNTILIYCVCHCFLFQSFSLTWQTCSSCRLDAWEISTLSIERVSLCFSVHLDVSPEVRRDGVGRRVWVMKWAPVSYIHGEKLFNTIMAKNSSLQMERNRQNQTHLFEDIWYTIQPPIKCNFTKTQTPPEIMSILFH